MLNIPSDEHIKFLPDFLINHEFCQRRASLHVDAFCSSLSWARIAIHGATWTHSRISTRMYLHVIIHIRGWKVVMRSPRHADRRVLESVAGVHWPSSCQLRPFVRGRAISPDPPWVWYHLPTEIMVSAMDVAPRGLHVLVYYICPRNPQARSMHTCVRPSCARKESTCYCPGNWSGSCRFFSWTILHLKDTAAINEGKTIHATFLTDSVLYEFFFMLEQNFRTPRSVRNTHLETHHQPQEVRDSPLTRRAVSLMLLRFFFFDELTEF